MIGLPARVRFPGIAVWAVCLLALGASDVHAQAAEMPARGYAIVLASALNVRATPALDGEILSSVVRGDTVCVLRIEDDDWLRVRHRDGSSVSLDARTPNGGYVARGFVSERRAEPDRLASLGCGGR